MAGSAAYSLEVAANEKYGGVVPEDPNAGIYSNLEQLSQIAGENPFTSSLAGTKMSLAQLAALSPAQQTQISNAADTTGGLWTSSDWQFLGLIAPIIAAPLAAVALAGGAAAGSAGADAAAAEGFGGDAALSTTGFGAGGTTLASGLGAQALADPALAQAAGTGTSLADGLGAQSLADPALAQAAGTGTSLADGLGAQSLADPALAQAGGVAADSTAAAGTGAAGAAASGAPSSLSSAAANDLAQFGGPAATGAGVDIGGAAAPSGLSGLLGNIPTSTLGNIAGSVISAAGAKSAANTIAGAANTAASDNLAIFNEQAALNEPFRQAGIGALAPLTAGAAPGGQFNTPYTLADFQSGPQSGLYNFANAQAQEALKNSTQAGGQNLSSNSAIQSGSLASNLASQYYNTGFNENQATNTMALNTLQGLAGEGQTATNAVNSDLSNLGTTQGNAALTAGNAQAAATQATANTIGNLLSSTAKDNSTMSYLSSLFS